MGTSDHELMRQVRERDAAAFEALYARYRGSVRLHLARIVRDQTAADDLLQEVFLRLWIRAEQWEGRGSLRSWLLRVATNLALNHLRSVRRRRQRPLDPPPVAAEEEEEGHAPSWMIDAAALGPDAILELAERRDRVRRLIGELTEEKQEVLRLIYEEEMDIRGAADALGIPTGTVKSRLHFARRRIARKWKDTEGSNEQ